MKWQPGLMSWSGRCPGQSIHIHMKLGAGRVSWSGKCRGQIVSIYTKWNAGHCGTSLRRQCTQAWDYTKWAMYGSQTEGVSVQCECVSASTCQFLSSSYSTEWKAWSRHIHALHNDPYHVLSSATNYKSLPHCSHFCCSLPPTILPLAKLQWVFLASCCGCWHEI